MALSQDEQRILAEIEQRLASDDPDLATSLAAFRRPGPAKMLRSPRVRVVGSLFTVLLVAMVSLTVYAMIPFRALQSRPATAGAPATTAMSAVTSTRPAAARQSSASGGTAPTAAKHPAAGIAAAARTSLNSTSHPATAASTSQQSDATAAIRDLIPTVNAKP